MAFSDFDLFYYKMICATGNVHISGGIDSSLSTSKSLSLASLYIRSRRYDAQGAIPNGLIAVIRLVRDLWLK